MKPLNGFNEMPGEFQGVSVATKLGYFRHDRRTFTARYMPTQLYVFKEMSPALFVLTESDRPKHNIYPTLMKCFF